MTPTTTVHFFPLVEHGPASPFCGEWREGHSWSVLTGAITCSRCRVLMAAIDARAQRAAHTERQRD